MYLAFGLFFLKQGINGVIKGKLSLPLIHYPLQLWFVKEAKERNELLRKITGITGFDAFIWGLFLLLIGVLFITIGIKGIIR